MELHRRSDPGNPITPIEPSAALDARSIDGDGRQASHATALGRFDVAVASSRGAHRIDNEDAHSELGGRGHLFVVADGVGGGAMAAYASRRLVRELHAALDGRRLDPARLSAAMLTRTVQLRDRSPSAPICPGPPPWSSPHRSTPSGRGG